MLTRQAATSLSAMELISGGGGDQRYNLKTLDARTALDMGARPQKVPPLQACSPPSLLFYPAWFETFRKKSSTQFDHGKHIDALFKLIAGGYIGIYDVGARRECRRTPRERWLMSK